MEEMGIVYIVSALIWSIIWGVIVKKVIENKGYYENWFWWGFFFGWIALIVALTKPDNNRGESLNDNSLLKKLQSEENTPSGWRCTCGKLNPLYVGTCDCGKNRYSKQESKAMGISAPLVNHSSVADDIKKYKELLDMGAITEAEFEAKKKELLNL